MAKSSADFSAWEGKRRSSFTWSAVKYAIISRFRLSCKANLKNGYGWINSSLVASLNAPFKIFLRERSYTPVKNWDTDGDWLNDFFEIDDDLLDGIRGNSGSPIRYDDRTS